MERINNINQLRELTKIKTLKCRIMVNAGMFGKLDIAKSIRYNLGQSKEWSVLNSDKNKFDNYTEKELKENTCIVEAINKGGLYYEN